MNDNRETNNNKQVKSRSAYGFAIAEILAALSMTGVLLAFGIGSMFVGPGIAVSSAVSTNMPLTPQAQVATQTASTSSPASSSSESGFVNAIQNRLNTMAVGDSQSQSAQSDRTNVSRSNSAQDNNDSESANENGSDAASSSVSGSSSSSAPLLGVE